jgi:hypothetical protein
MCMEDIRLGRKLAAGCRVVAVAAGAVRELCGPDPNRTRLAFSSAGGQVVWVGPASLAPTTTAGWTLPTANPQMVLTVEVWGRLIQERWLAIVNAGSENVTVMEGHLGET